MAGPRCATIPILHQVADGLGAGEQERLHPQGMGIRYRVEVRQVGPIVAPTG